MKLKAMKLTTLKWPVLSLLILAVLSLPGWINHPIWLSFFAQIGIMIVVCASYQLLFGQAGMLSFGHAIYFGLAAFICLHSLNRWQTYPIVFLPLLSACGVALLALLIGLLSCRSTNTVFSMISLALAELFSASALMFADFFGGEGGISANRVREANWLAWNFASQNQMTGLILVYAVVAVLAMYAWQATPLGRLAQAVRDNPERLSFLGFNPRWVKILSLMTAAFFAGIAGALNALQYELASAENLSVHRSGLILLFTIIGGSQHIVGALLGAMCGVVFTSFLSDWTPAWSLYLGVFFILVVRFFPGGLLATGRHFVLFLRQLAGLPVAYACALISMQIMRALSALLALLLSVEFLYQRNLQSDSVWHGLHWRWDTRDWQTWLWPLGFLILASVLHVLLRHRYWGSLRHQELRHG